MDEAHVHHLVGFVEDEDFDIVHAQRALIDQIEQAARGGDENIDALRKVTNLLVDRHAAEHGRHAQLGETTIVAAALRDLRGEFARRRQHQHAAAARIGTVRIGQQMVDRRQRETGRLAGTRLRNAAQIATFHQRRDRLRLDRGRGGIILGGKRAIDVGVQAKVVESRHNILTMGDAHSARSHRTDGARPRVRNDPRERVPQGTKRGAGSSRACFGRENHAAGGCGGEVRHAALHKHMANITRNCKMIARAGIAPLAGSC